MAVIVNNPGGNEPNDSGWGPLSMLLVLIFGAVLIYFLMVYALPAMRQAVPSGGNTIQQNQTAPPANQNGGNSPQINVPDKVDINLKQQK